MNGAPFTDYFSTTDSTAIIIPAGPISIGRGYADTFSPMDNGGITMVMVYEKLLSDTEIEQIYNSLKGRYR